jgi:hypothetical protein
LRSHAARFGIGLIFATKGFIDYAALYRSRIHGQRLFEWRNVTVSFGGMRWRLVGKRSRSYRQMKAGSKLGIDATKKISGEGFKHHWPAFIKMDAAVKARVEKLFGS